MICAYPGWILVLVTIERMIFVLYPYDAKVIVSKTRVICYTLDRNVILMIQLAQTSKT